MALNLKTLGIRSLSAIVFVIALVGCVYWNYYSFSIFFFIVSMLGLIEFYKIAEKMGTSPYKIIGFILGALIYVSLIFIRFDNFFEGISYYLVTFKICIVLLPFLVFAYGIFSNGAQSFNKALFTIGGILYAVLPFALLNELVCLDINNSDSYFNPMLILGIIFLIWANDTFAYLGGSIFGKNKMIERISPGKTWEGTAIGVFVSFGLSFSFSKIVYPLESWIWPVLGICVPVLATVGDLLESKLKREAGIKDSGNIMPGHGGILDRFDSLIFVSPFVYAFFMLIKAL